jgi:hypothetical protein
MKTLRWMLVGLLLGAGPATAAVCTVGALSDYVALGSAGCTIDGVTFSGFANVTPLNPDATPISPSSVSLTPLTGPGGPGFAVSSGTALSASANTLLELWFGFVASAGSGSSLGGATLSLGSSSVVPDGVNTIIADICPDGSFSSPSSGCGTSPASLIVFDTGDASTLSESATSGPSSFFDVFFDLTIDGGLGGSAMLGPKLGELRLASSGGGGGTVPEPATWLLLALVPAAATCARRSAAARRATSGRNASSPHHATG